MPKKGIDRACPACGAYGRIVTREPVAGKPGATFIAASCVKCGRSDRTRARRAASAVVTCKREDCREPLMLAEVASYDGYCSACAYARSEERL